MPNDDDKHAGRWPLDLTGNRRDEHRVKTPPTGVSRAITQGAVLMVEVDVDVEAENFEDDHTDPRLPVIEQIRHTQVKQAKQIGGLKRDHAALATTVARSEGKLDILVEVAQGDIKKIKLQRPVAIIAAIAAAIVLVIEALR